MKMLAISLMAVWVGAPLAAQALNQRPQGQYLNYCSDCENDYDKRMFTCRCKTPPQPGKPSVTFYPSISLERLGTEPNCMKHLMVVGKRFKCAPPPLNVQHH